MTSFQQSMNARTIATQNYIAAAIICLKAMIVPVAAVGMLVVMSSALEALTSIGTVIDQAQQLKGY